MRGHIPLDQLIRPPEKTSRERYVQERTIYRYSQFLIRKGEVLDERNYYFYSQIAKKYGWPYIKESYDD